MARVAWGEPVYNAADVFRQRVMVEGRSFLWPEHEAWTDENMQAALAALEVSPQQGNAEFYASMREQLESADDDVIRVAADAMAFFVLFFRSNWYGAARKWESVNTVVEWRETIKVDQAARTMLDAAFEQGIAESNTAFQSRRGQHLGFLVRFVVETRRQAIDVNDPEVVRQVAASAMRDEGTTTAMRPRLLHMLFPEEFEEVVNESDRVAIVRTFPDLIGHATNQDDQLHEIRSRLAIQYDDESLALLNPGVKAQ